MSDTGETGTGESPPKKKRRVWPWILAVVVLVVAVVGFFVADAAVKSYASNLVKQRIIQVLQLDPATPISVDLGGGSILLQALSGKVSTVHVTAPKVSFGALTGSAVVHATDVPLDQNAPVGTLAVTVSVDQADLGAITGNLSGAQLTSITLAEPDIVVNTQFSILGFGIPVGMGLVPSASNGQIVFTPSTITVGQQSFSADDLRNNPIFSGLAGALLTQQNLCVADRLPKALTVSDVKVSGSQLVVTVTGDGAALGGSDLTTLGSCG